MKTKYQLFFIALLFAAGVSMSAGAQTEDLPKVADLPPSITEQQELEFYSRGIFVQCNQAATEKRRYSFSTKPTTNANYELVQTLLDITAWVHIDGFDELMESHSGDSIQNTEVVGNQTRITLRRGNIAFKRNNASGVLNASFDFDGVQDVQMTCAATAILCQSVDKTDGKFFFVKLLPSQKGKFMATVIYQFTPEGFTSGPVVGNTLTVAQGDSNSTSANLQLQGPNGIRGHLKFGWKKSQGFSGNLSFEEPSLKVSISNSPVTCRLGF